MLTNKKARIALNVFTEKIVREHKKNAEDISMLVTILRQNGVKDKTIVCILQSLANHFGKKEV